MKTSAAPSFSTRRRGFTLIEMLTVVGIIAALMALMAPALLDVLRSSRLNAAGDGLVNRISLAQQSAISLGREVEMRFYRYVDSDQDGSGTPLFMAYQVIDLAVVSENNEERVQPKALSDPYYIESGVILSALDQMSPLLATTTRQQPQKNGSYLFTPTVAGVEPSDVQYAALKFYPDGSCKMLSQDDPSDQVADNAFAYTIPTLANSFFTFVEARDANVTQPKNFYCIQIDSYTGKTRVYRP